MQQQWGGGGWKKQIRAKPHPPHPPHVPVHALEREVEGDLVGDADWSVQAHGHVQEALELDSPVQVGGPPLEGVEEGAVGLGHLFGVRGGACRRQGTRGTLLHLQQEI